MIRRELIELSLFVLNRRTNNVRKEIHDYLVMGSLFDPENPEKNFDQIVDHISSECGFVRNSDIDRLVRRSLRRLSNAEKVRSKAGIYKLSVDALQDFKRMVESYDERRSKVLLKLYDRISRIGIEIAESERERINDCFMAILSKILSDVGAQCVKMFSGLPFQSQPEYDIEKTIKSVLSNIQPKIFKKAMQDGIMSLFREPDKEESEFLHLMAQSYVLMEILNVDPLCRSIQRSRLRYRKLYLDTNILISLLCNGERAHKPTLTIMQIINDLQIKTRMTKRTKQEFLDRLQKSEDLVKSVEDVSDEVIEGVTDLMEDPFIKTFWLRKKDEPKLSWRDFILPLVNLEYTLEDKHKVRFDKLTYEDILLSSNIPELTEIIQEVSPDKTPNVAQHDAFHIELTTSLRNKEPSDELGPKYWFLTRDSTLPYVEWIHHRDIVPSSVYAGTYIEMISPFIAPDIEKKTAPEVFSRLLSTRVPPIAERVRPIDLIDITRDWTDDPKLTVRTIRKLVGQRYVQEYLEKIRSLPVGPERSLALEKLKDEIGKELKRERIKESKTQKILSWLLSGSLLVIFDLIAYIIRLFDPSIFLAVAPIEAAFLIGFPRIYDWLITRSIELPRSV